MQTDTCPAVYINRTNVTHLCSCTSLAVWVQHWTTAATEFMCSLPLCHSHWGKEVNSTRFVPFALCSVRPVYLPLKQMTSGLIQRDVVIRSKGQDGILWTCQYVVNMETAYTSETGMGCPAHVHCSYSAEWELFLHSPHKDSFKSTFEMQCTDC